MWTWPGRVPAVRIIPADLLLYSSCLQTDASAAELQFSFFSDIIQVFQCGCVCVCVRACT